MSYSSPSYIAHLVMDADSEILSKIQKDYGNASAFKFTNKIQSLILSYDEDTKEYGGRIWGVETTGSKFQIFDQHKHGYNGVLELTDEDDISSTKIIEFSKPIELIIGFQYSGDEAEYIIDGPSKDEQDYFGWVVFYKQTDNSLEEIIGFECA